LLKSKNWGIGQGIGIGGGKGKGGAGVTFYTLLDVDNQLLYGMAIGMAGVSFGLPFQLTISSPGFTFFTTKTAIEPSDFSGGVVIFAMGEITILGGYSSLCYISFHGVDHDPSWIDVSGFENGFAVNIGGLSAGLGKVFATPTPVSGCPIVPNGSNNNCATTPNGAPYSVPPPQGPNSSSGNQSSATQSSGP